MSLELQNTNCTANDFKNQVEFSKAEIITLNKQVEELKTKNEIIEDSLNAKLAESKEMKEQLSDSMKNAALLNAAVAEKECQIDQMKMLIQSLSQENTEFQSQNAQQVHNHLLLIK